MDDRWRDSYDAWKLASPYDDWIDDPQGYDEMTTQFQTGKTYSTRSIADYDTIFSFTILGRTEKTVTTKVRGKTVRRGLFLFDGVEQFKPFGTYSMCAIISADRAAA